jgi:hypothetical protein
MAVEGDGPSSSPLLFRRRDKLAVADKRSCGIAVEGVEAEDDHARVNNWPAPLFIFTHDRNHRFGIGGDPTNTDEMYIIEASLHK